jgi:hypothetical protein
VAREPVSNKEQGHPPDGKMVLKLDDLTVSMNYRVLPGKEVRIRLKILSWPRTVERLSPLGPTPGAENRVI